MSQLVPIKLMQLLLLVVEAQGIDVDTFLKEHDFSYNPLDETADPAGLPTHVSAADYNYLYQSITWLLQDECFGLHLKGKMPSGTFRMMCLYIIHCKTLEDAIDRVNEFTRFCRNVAGLPAVQYTPLIKLDDGSVINLMPDTDGIDSNQSLVAVAASMHMWRKFCAWLIGKPLPLLKVQFTHSAPDKVELMEEVFGCPITFNAKVNGFFYQKSLLSSPIIHNEDSLNEFLKQAPYQLSVSHFDESSIQTRIQAIVGNDFSKDFPTLEEVSSQLNMSARTLRRRLKDEETSYQEFKDQLRMEAAKIYLKRPGLKINAVAALMGFDEPSAFHRAFKKWTTQTPGEYRNQLTENL
ncbi:MAG: AraC family transcriptional regulator [Sinobacterium sp.]|nr:AraC family transcriptional regulator [Sinobacterium sp.]